MNNTTREIVESSALGEKYELIHHKSGLDIYVYPKKIATTYALFATHYGSVDNKFMIEGENEPTEVPLGIAHFLEHKMFTKEDGSDSFDRFSELGADANAYTSYDKTVYLFSCTSNFSECLSELIDFVTHPFFTKETVKKERGIIGEEIGMYDDSPQNRSYYGMLEGLYHHHDIKNNVCGTVESIAKITPELLYRCHKVFYNLSNMALVVCGNVEAEEVIEIADKCLKEQKSVNIIRQKSKNEPPHAAKEKVISRMLLAKPIFDIGIKDIDVPKAPQERERRDIVMSIIADLLFSSTGALYSRLYEERLISPNPSSSYTISEDFAYTSFSGESDDPEKVYNIVKEFIAKKQTEGFCETEFIRCRKVFYSSFVRGLDSADDIANELVAYIFDGYNFFGYADIISKITLEEVNAIFRSAFAPESFTLSAVYPLDEKSK